MSRHRAFWLLACVLLLVPFGSAIRQAGSQPKEQPGDLVVRGGQHISWQGWQFQWTIHPRNGLVIEDVSFKGRSVLKYGGLAEIFVPYNKGEPRPHDFGSSIATRLIELLPGQDCIRGANACMAWNDKGKDEGKRVVMLHEEDTGLSYVGNLGRAKGKMLVLWCAYNLGGYHYLSRWKFSSDGSLTPEIGLTGPLQHIGKGESSPYGSLVGKNQVFAPSHVHNIYYCLDFDIDGSANTVEEFNYQQDAPGSLSGKHSWTPLTKETGRPASADNFRCWRIVNHASKNALGLPRSYELIPGGNGIYRGSAKEPFAQAELWVTKHHPKEGAGDNKSLSHALPMYLNGEAIDNQNVVVWYALHIHHLPRTEDWPGMPVEWASFTLKPRDFLDTTPVAPKK